MYEPEIAIRNKLVPFWLPTSLGITFSAVKHFTFKPRASPAYIKKWGAHFVASAPGAENPGYATAAIAYDSEKFANNFALLQMYCRILQ